MTTRCAVGLVAIVLSACAGGDEAASERRADGADATRTLVQTAAYVPVEAGLCAGAPATVAGMSVWVDAAGLWRGARGGDTLAGPSLIQAWEPGEVPRSPVVRVADILVATRTTDGCRLRRYDAHGAPGPVREVVATDCTGPAAVSGIIAWPLADELGGEHRVEWFDDARSPHTWVTPLGERPVTSALSFGKDVVSGGGSHWLVGTERGVVVIEDRLSRRLEGEPDPTVIAAPAIVARFDEPAGVVTSVVPLSDPGASTSSGRTTLPRMAVATIRVDGDEGLGRHLRVLELTFGDDAGTLAPLGELIALPGALTAHPVAIDRCSLAGGGSHWFCGDGDIGALVAGGEGWLAAWGVPTGRALFEHQGELTWTGLAIGSGGWIAGGGSHWLPGRDDAGWSVRALHPGPTGDRLDLVELELASGPETDACVPSPLWDTNGDLEVPVLAPTATLARVELAGLVQGLALGRGQTRPLGGNANTGYSTSEPGRCSDGTVRDLHVERLTGEEIAGIAAAGDVVFVFGARAGAGFVRRVVFHGATSELVLDETPFVEHVVPRDTPSGAIHALVSTMHRVDAAPVQRFTEYDERWAAAWSRDLQLGPEGAFIGVAPLFEDAYVVGTRGGAFDRVRVLRQSGFTEPITFDEQVAPTGLERLLTNVNDDVMMVLVDGDGALHLRRLDAELDELALVTHRVPDRVVAVIDATFGGDGGVRLLVNHVIPEGGGESRWLHFDADLRLVADRAAPFLGSMGGHVDGSALINTAQGLVRVAPDGQLGIPRPLAPDLLPLDRMAVAPLTFESGYVVALRRFADAGAELWLARTDLAGFASCASAGLCLGEASVTSCDTALPCEQRGCDPATGACAGGPIPFCQP
ncbi:MAG: hypothetical protein IT385_23120 [Deltaproteobacteria bacterium]|nr:hypothetical protein [Deltaproteobacteria bacterium]